MGQNVAYFNSVTERESGWGSRPDGYLVAKTKEQFVTKAAKIKAAGSYQEFSSVDGEPRLCLITDEMAAKLEAAEEGAIWTNDKSWFIE